MPLRIFISYRREDTRPTVGRIYDLIRTAEFSGHVKIFRDVSSIQLGEKFVSVVNKALQDSDVFLVLIGSNWLDTIDASGKRRIDAEDDPVRVEVASAIRRKVPIIPVLVDGARLPKAADLPHEIAELSGYQALEIDNDRFEDDAAKLINDLRKRLPIRFVLWQWLISGLLVVVLIVGIWFTAKEYLPKIMMLLN